MLYYHIFKDGVFLFVVDFHVLSVLTRSIFLVPSPQPSAVLHRHDFFNQGWFQHHNIIVMSAAIEISPYRSNLRKYHLSEAIHSYASPWTHIESLRLVRELVSHPHPMFCIPLPFARREIDHMASSFLYFLNFVNFCLGHPHPFFSISIKPYPNIISLIAAILS